ncbi:hypothetical protein EYC84_008341 [Monilinia fructicola]|uniref:Uncharacterized protein n=1 Tax=Monilinia fructicola TaxID=38448 RepID=A0A5M9JLH5_MONFR|nr:hypothetical protein EYC84_008341 [Monilinia fructicola]
MTETSPVSCMTTPTDPMDKRLDSVGRLSASRLRQSRLAVSSTQGSAVGSAGRAARHGIPGHEGILCG